MRWVLFEPTYARYCVLSTSLTAPQLGVELRHFPSLFVFRHQGQTICGRLDQSLCMWSTACCQLHRQHHSLEWPGLSSYLPFLSKSKMQHVTVIKVVRPVLMMVLPFLFCFFFKWGGGCCWLTCALTIELYMLLYLAQHHTLHTTSYNSTSHTCTRHSSSAHTRKSSLLVSSPLYLLSASCVTWGELGHNKWRRGSGKLRKWRVRS